MSVLNYMICSGRALRALFAEIGEILGGVLCAR